MRVRVLLVTLLAVALVAGLWWWKLDRRTTFEDALATLPAETLRASYTDWAGVHAKLGDEPLARFIDDAYDSDLSRLSAVESNGALLGELYGLDLRKASWEVYGQADEGAVAVLALPSGFGTLRAKLRSVGYAEPSSEDRAWTISEGALSTVDPTLTPVLLNFVVLEDAGLVVLSDSASYAETAASVAVGDGDALLPEVDDLAAEAEDPVSALLWAGDYACEDLAMSSADDGDQARGRALVDAAGGVSPVDGMLMAADPSGTVRVAFGFESDDQARDNLQPRTDLASGEAPGLGGSFPDRFKITDATRDGSLVVLDLEPTGDDATLLSEISDGPILFATC